MNPLRALGREISYVSGMLRVRARYKAVANNPKRLVPDLIGAVAAKHPNFLALIDEDVRWTYAELEAYANRVANWALGEGIEPGEPVALFMLNRAEYLAVWYGLSKIGAIPALINTHLSGHSLEHCIGICGARRAIVEPDLAGVLAEAVADAGLDLEVWSACGAAPGARDFDRALDEASSEPPGRERIADTRIGDLFMIMFTSGTTGLPKVARMTHSRALGYMTVFAAACKATPRDRMLMVLPMYHATGGLCGVGAALSVGGAVIVRRHFSASHFWDEAARFKATLFMYVGELCRFLMAQPPHPAEREHRIRAAMGNGLRPDVWRRFEKRTGIPLIVEFYGATEGNVGLMNIGGPPGAIGRVAPYLRKIFNIELVRHDVETGVAVRGEDGFCIPAEPGEVGEAIGEIRKDDPRYRFEGYSDPKETEKKVLRDVFAPGDAWFRTGDLMRRDALGYYYFVDRVGDTFRWMAENVSTGEVEEALSVFPGVHSAIVYGVPVLGYDGRAGMAAITPEAAAAPDLDALAKHLDAELPPYAKPVFLRMMAAPETTGTFKFRKTDLKAQGFDLGLVSDPLFYLAADGGYLPLDRDALTEIETGQIRF